jgi:hypothetical protein
MPGPGRRIVKGQVLNPNGRGKGNPNRSTKEIREFIQKVVSKKLDEFEDDLEKMSPANQWNIIEKVAKYFMPALSKTEIEGQIDGEINIKISFDDDVINGDDMTASE